MICLCISSVYFGLLRSYRHDGDSYKSDFSYDRERNCNKVKSNDCIKSGKAGLARPRHLRLKPGFQANLINESNLDLHQIRYT